MRRLLNPEALADNLETGIGNSGWYYDLIPKNLRLRLPVCDIISLAIADALIEQGHRVGLVHSKPKLEFDPHESHVFPIVHDIGHELTVIDATFGSLLKFAGLTPEGVLGNQENNYPFKKIITFERDDAQYPAEILTKLARVTLRQWVPSTALPQQRPAFGGLTTSEMQSNFAEFWNPANFNLYEPSKEVIEAAAVVRNSIEPTNLRLTDY